MTQPLIGAPLDRAEGREKVTGAARYTADVALEGMVHAVVIPSSIANGRVVSIDGEAARGQEGVIALMTHRNAPRVTEQKASPNQSHLFLLQKDVVEFDRQPVAVVIAQTFEQATHAADLVRVEYAEEAPQTDLDAAAVYRPEEIFGEPATHERKKPMTAFGGAPARVDQIYRTPTEHHNPMEMHATVAVWHGERLTLYDSSQWAFGVRDRMAHIFGIPSDRITVVSKYVGGAFGGKGQPWSHVPLAAMAAKLVERPVKLVLTRPQMFGWLGHRPQTEQHVRIGAERNGTLVSVLHDVRSETSVSDEYVEPCGVFSRDLYAVPNYRMSHELRRLNIAKPTFQRAPGESTGSFAIESAMDELAYALEIDPLELRLINYSERNPDSDKPYTSKHLRECYSQAAQRFGWSRRNPKVRALQNGRMLVGMGMATASRATHRSEASVRITIHPDGTVEVASGTIEQGTGSPTVFPQLAAEILGVAYDRVRFNWGDTTLPNAPLAAGSQTAASVGSAVAVAASLARKRLNESHGNIPPEGIVIVHHEKPSEEDEERYAQQAFGAQFAEVEVDPDLGMVRVTRFVGAYDGGRILNRKTAYSQFLGGCVWGISMALFEKSRYDVRTARIMNAELAHYLVPTNADVPDIDVFAVEADDPNVNPAHVRGIGEVSMCGSAAAVANAVYHATGVRVRELPITVEKLLT